MRGNRGDWLKNKKPVELEDMELDEFGDLVENLEFTRGQPDNIDKPVMNGTVPDDYTTGVPGRQDFSQPIDVDDIEDEDESHPIHDYDTDVRITMDASDVIVGDHNVGQVLAEYGRVIQIQMEEIRKLNEALGLLTSGTRNDNPVQHTSDQRNPGRVQDDNAIFREPA
jgi:hypothetical protein